MYGCQRINHGDFPKHIWFLDLDEAILFKKSYTRHIFTQNLGNNPFKFRRILSH